MVGGLISRRACKLRIHHNDLQKPFPHVLKGCEKDGKDWNVWKASWPTLMANGLSSPGASSTCWSVEQCSTAQTWDLNDLFNLLVLASFQVHTWPNDSCNIGKHKGGICLCFLVCSNSFYEIPIVQTIFIEMWNGWLCLCRCSNELNWDQIIWILIYIRLKKF